MHKNILKDTNTEIFLLSGKAGSGKDTLADYLVEKYNFIKISFADELKKQVSKKYKIHLNYFYSREGKKKIVRVYDGQKFVNTSLRSLLINEANTQKSINSDVWVETVIERIKNLKQENKRIVIPDFRFPNEFYSLNAKFTNMTTINIYRNEHEYIEDISEYSLENFLFNYNFLNNKTKQDLFDIFEDCDLII